MKQEAKRREWETYTADSIGAIVTRLFRWSGAENFEYPLYSELGKPKAKQQSAEEIKNSIIKRLTS